MSNCCIFCYTYQKDYGGDACCATCARNRGNGTHGTGCKRIPCTEGLAPQMAPNCCIFCHTYQKDYGGDACCATCARNRGDGIHGTGCKRIPCTGGLAPQIAPQHARIIPCHILYSPNTICFYEANQPYYEFSNFYDAQIQDKGVVWYANSEVYFQSRKFPPGPIRNRISASTSARQASHLAHQNAQYVMPAFYQPFNGQY